MRHGVFWVALQVAGCAVSAPETGFELMLPDALSGERAAYESEIRAALDHVTAWYARHGLASPKSDVIDTAIVFAEESEARRAIAGRFGVKDDAIPVGFSGTVDGKTLFVVRRELYARTYARLYPEHPWRADDYRALIAHELAHRLHASKATTIFGSEDGMGPRWFFEGLAITCASQFEPSSTLSWPQIQELIVRDAKGPLNYPLYGQMVRSLAASFPIRWLVEYAGRPDFVDLLQREYLPSEFVLEHPADRPSRGSILLVHGSAPFDLDGRIPIPGLDSPYARTRFTRDLGQALRAAGWSVLRYSKPGVQADRIDAEAYATTDLELLGRQLRNLWRFLPADRPRVVFAWSEGTLHVRALPMDEIDAVILLGGISSTIADVIQAQGGPSPEALRKELVGKSRRDMLGVDRPVGRLLDELDLEENWTSFQGLERLRMLVLHGTEDREVPLAQVALWKKRLPPADIVEGPGLDHRFMPRDVYDIAPLAREVAAWLDRHYPAC
ncbi:MAG: alpha/beta hydrolase [Planctomycetes bacterium]|nr:alpha/beta hydrolase [Planctomycetota bacterium]